MQQEKNHKNLKLTSCTQQQISQAVVYYFVEFRASLNDVMLQHHVEALIGGVTGYSGAVFVEIV